MAERAMNRNAQRSIRLLKEAFMELLAEKSYQSITVSDVARKADLNRGTFYAHFDNVDDLMRSVMADAADRISEFLSKAVETGFLEDPMPVLTQVGDYLDQNRELTRKLVESRSVEPFVFALEARFREWVQRRIPVRTPQEKSASAVLTDYVAGGVLQTYRSWIVGDCPGVEIGEINKYLCEFVRSTGAGLQGLRLG
ncbi:TetR/AcrR family transcriptional regulator [Olsenella sp. Marseille-P4559]|jgi:AcrR family transcriptional regulator|uniref:TetR/AcrR family transcriptional regulator n=1 Tax=Olsenella sp. Marseille-P4559 TaxID=2364795 RepID=UPI0013EEF7D5|nr:TetR/AcrR family transcriptional regulator [Olsenella sp. Marseille-P4559]